jgi:hypothetical protein
MHLLAHGRMQPVGGDQQAACRFPALAVAVLQERGDAFAVRVIAIAGDLDASGDCLRSDPLQHRAIEQHLQLAAMDGVLRPVVAGAQTARLGVHVLAVETDQRPFERLDADGGECFRADAHFVELAHGVGLQVDAHAQRLELRDGFKDVARDSDLVERERGGEAADAGARDEDWTLAHCASRR